MITDDTINAKAYQFAHRPHLIHRPCEHLQATRMRRVHHLGRHQHPIRVE